MTKGVLVHCDASIKAIIMKINSEDGNIYIIEDIDDEHILIQESKHAQLKQRLNAVRVTHCIYCLAKGSMKADIYRH
jgi:TFIIH basal transcription factor complex TTD-A subunit